MKHALILTLVFLSVLEGGSRFVRPSIQFGEPVTPNYPYTWPPMANAGN